MRRSSSFKKAKERVIGFVKGNTPGRSDDVQPMMTTIRMESEVHSTFLGTEKPTMVWKPADPGKCPTCGGKTTDIGHCEACARQKAYIERAKKNHVFSTGSAHSRASQQDDGWSPKDALPPSASLSGKQRFPVGQAVYVLRSSGEETIGFVEHYSTSTGIYDIVLERPDSNVRKKATEETMRVAAPAAAAKAAALSQQFAMGSMVLVQRSSGEESVAYVKEYNPIKGIYKVELDGVGSGLMKFARSDMMRHPPQGGAPLQGSVQDGVVALV